MFAFSPLFIPSPRASALTAISPGGSSPTIGTRASYSSRGPASVTPSTTTQSAPSSTPFAYVGGFAQAKHASSLSQWQFTTSATVPSGNLMICAYGVDNDGDGQDTADMSLTSTDTINSTWTRWLTNEVDPGAGAAGAFVGTYFAVAPTDLPAGSTITVNFGAAKIAKSAQCVHFSKASSVVVSSVTNATPSGVLAKEDVTPGADAGSLSTSTLTSREYLFVRCQAVEGQNAFINSPTTNFTVWPSTGHNSGSDSSSMWITCESVVQTTTSITSDPTLSVTTLESAGALGALKQDP